jgi:hypothetical protein
MPPTQSRLPDLRGPRATQTPGRVEAASIEPARSKGHQHRTVAAPQRTPRRNRDDIGVCRPRGGRAFASVETILSCPAQLTHDPADPGDQRAGDSLPGRSLSNLRAKDHALWPGWEHSDHDIARLRRRGLQDRGLFDRLLPLHRPHWG